MRTAHLSFVSALTLGLTLALGSAIVAPETAYADRPGCFDGIDNDNDGRIDYPGDFDCSSIDDTSEWPDTGVFVSVTDGKDTTAANGTLVYQIRVRQEREAVKLVDLSIVLPPQLGITYVSSDGVSIQGSVIWRKVAVFKGEERMFYVHAMVAPNIAPGTLLVARVVADSATATDTTMVQKGVTVPYTKNQLLVQVTDNRDRVLPNEVVDYIITVQNPENTAATVHVRVPVPQVLIVSDTAPFAETIGKELVWRDVTIEPRQTKVFTVRATIHSMAPNAYPVQLVARAGTVVGYDRSVVGNGQLTQTILTSHLSDHRTLIARGQYLTYTLHIDNRSGWLDNNAPVNAAIPQYGEFVAATEGGYWDGKNVRWPGLFVAPGGSRDLEFTIRVRSDAPDGTVLKATSYVQGSIYRDETRVSSTSPEQNNGYRSAYKYHYAAPSRGVMNGISLQKSANVSEVRAGDSITFRVNVSNISNSDVRSIVVEDAYLTEQLWVEEGNGGEIGNDTVRWYIDTLRPGEVRSFSYTARVSDHLPLGTMIVNETHAYVGSSSTPVYAASNDVFVMPRTGAMDYLFSPVENTAQYLSPVSSSSKVSLLLLALPVLALLGSGAVIAARKIR